MFRLSRIIRASFSQQALRFYSIRPIKESVTFEYERPGFQSRQSVGNPTSYVIGKFQIYLAREDQDYPRAIELAQKYIEYSKEKGQNEDLLEFHFELAQLYYSTNCPDNVLKAQSHLKQIYKIGQDQSAYSKLQKKMNDLIEYWFDALYSLNMSRFLQNTIEILNEEKDSYPREVILELEILESFVTRESGILGPQSLETSILGDIPRLKQLADQAKKKEKGQNLEQTEQIIEPAQRLFDLVVKAHIELFRLEFERRNFKEALIKINKIFDLAYFDQQSPEQQQILFEVRTGMLFDYYFLTNQMEELKKIIEADEHKLNNSEISYEQWFYQMNRKVRYQLKIEDLTNVEPLLESLEPEEENIFFRQPNQQSVYLFSISPRYEIRSTSFIDFNLLRVQFYVLKNDKMNARDIMDLYHNQQRCLSYQPMERILVNSLEADLLELEGNIPNAINYLQESIDEIASVLGENSEQIKRLELQKIKLELQQMKAQTKGKSIEQEEIQNLKLKAETCFQVFKEKGTYGNSLEIKVEKLLEELLSQSINNNS